MSNTVTSNGKLVKISSKKFDKSLFRIKQVYFYYELIYENNETYFKGISLITTDTNIGVIIKNRNSLGFNGYTEYKVLIKDKYYWLCDFYEVFKVIQ